jgi:hypothetical protein
MISTTENNATEAVTATVWIGFAMMCICMFMAILDVQVVATSLATIQEALNIARDQMSWIQTSYLIAEIIAIPLTGFLTRLLTMRWLFVVAVSVFTFASIACAMSGNFSSLISWRIVQGFSGGTLIPVVFSVVFLLFPIGRRSRYREGDWHTARGPDDSASRSGETGAFGIADRQGGVRRRDQRRMGFGHRDDICCACLPAACMARAGTGGSSVALTRGASTDSLIRLFFVAAGPHGESRVGRCLWAADRGRIWLTLFATPTSHDPGRR